VPTRVFSRSGGQANIDAASGYVYDELVRDTGLATDSTGRITNVSPVWAKHALGRVLDLQEALDKCEAERKAALRP
jgi:hypothetical protein